MSAGTHIYDYIKDENDLKCYLGKDLNRMLFFVNETNVICEGQFEKLDSNIIEEHGGLFMKLLSSISGNDVVVDYSNISHIYFLYIPSNVSREKAFEIVKHWNEYYYLN